MANEMKTLAKETAIYGLSSILGKFLNWCLVPLYTYVLTSSADYGVVANLYAWTALLLVILTYGMETGLFRFLNKEGRDNSAVYPTTVICLFVSSVHDCSLISNVHPSLYQVSFFRTIIFSSFLIEL